MRTNVVWVSLLAALTACQGCALLRPPEQHAKIVLRVESYGGSLSLQVDLTPPGAQQEQ